MSRRTGKTTCPRPRSVEPAFYSPYVAGQRTRSLDDFPVRDESKQDDHHKCHHEGQTNQAHQKAY